MFLGLYTKVRSFFGDLRESMTDESGAVATEYGLLIVLIALAIVLAATALGAAISGKFDDASKELGGA